MALLADDEAAKPIPVLPIAISSTRGTRPAPLAAPTEELNTDVVERELPAATAAKPADGGPLVKSQQEHANALLKTLKGGEEVRGEVLKVMQACRSVLAKHQGTSGAAATAKRTPVASEQRDTPRSMGIGMFDAGGGEDCDPAAKGMPCSMMLQVENLIQKRFGEFRIELAAAFEEVLNQRLGQPAQAAPAVDAEPQVGLDNLRSTLNAALEDPGQADEAGAAEEPATQKFREALRQIGRTVETLVVSSAHQRNELQEMGATYRAEIHDLRANLEARKPEPPDLSESNIANIRASLEKVRQNLTSTSRAPPQPVGLNTVKSTKSMTTLLEHDTGNVTPMTSRSDRTRCGDFAFTPGMPPHAPGEQRADGEEHAAVRVQTLDSAEINRANLTTTWPSLAMNAGDSYNADVEVFAIHTRGQPTPCVTRQSSVTRHASAVTRQTSSGIRIQHSGMGGGASVNHIAAGASVNIAPWVTRMTSSPLPQPNSQSPTKRCVILSPTKRDPLADSYRGGGMTNAVEAQAAADQLSATLAARQVQWIQQGVASPPRRVVTTSGQYRPPGGSAHSPRPATKCTSP